MKCLWVLAALVCMASLSGPGRVAGPVADHRGAQFIGVTDFSDWTPGPGDADFTDALTSPIIRPDIDWNEMVVSWNTSLGTDVGMKVEARAVYPERTSKWYTMGLWCEGHIVPFVYDQHLSEPGEESPPRPGYRARQSRKNQKDADGDVDTDTLIMKQPGGAVQVRVSFSGARRRENLRERLRFIGLSFLDSRTRPETLPPNQAAWGKTIDVPEKCQGDYPNGSVLCSPTCTSMLLDYWSRKLDRPLVARDVPIVAEGVYDPNWPGTGNWPFNTAYAGSIFGMRGYVSRFTDVLELEDWIAAGIPVACSVSWDVLRGKEPPSPSGHLVVCVGFTKDGDPVINDPARNPKKGKSVRTVYPRKNLIAAWAKSKNTVYLIYPESAKVPTDRFGHWEARNQ